MKSRFSRNRYDVPLLAMMKALNEIPGKGWHHGSYVRQAWLFYQGSDEWGFYDALEKVKALYPKEIQTEMVERAGGVLELWIRVDKELV